MSRKKHTNISVQLLYDFKFNDCIELDDLIVDWESKEPEKKNKVEYLDWKIKMNYLYQSYNKLVGFKCYGKIN